MLVAYSASISPTESSSDWKSHPSYGDADGIVLIWSTVSSLAPEYKFTCQSQVLSALFHPYDRNVIIGGTYGGQVSTIMNGDRLL